MTPNASACEISDRRGDQQEQRSRFCPATPGKGPAIDYDKAFKRLCHLHALSVTGKTTAALDDLVVSAVVLADGCCSGVRDIGDAIEAFFGLSIPKDDLDRAVCRRLEARTLLRLPSGRIVASPDAQAAVASRTKAAQDLEDGVRREWYDDLSKIGVAIGEGDDLWSCLKHYLALVFRQHGALSIELLATSEIADDAASRDAALSVALRDRNYDDTDVARVAIAAFFSHVTDARSRYLAQLLDGTFTFFALTVHDAAAEYLRGTVEPLTLFLDTNFVFAILDVQDNPLSDIARQLLQLIKENQFPFRLYVHEETLEEIHRTTPGIGSRLRSCRWSQEISKAALDARVLGHLSGVELKYHQLNAQNPINVDTFLSRFQHVEELLEEHGIRLYREPFAGKDNVWAKGELIAEYQAYLDSERPDLQKPYETISHDITVWVATQRYRRSARMPISAGALFLTLDGVLHGFDRKVLRQSGAGTVALPNQLYQLLRPFARPDLELDRRFVETFAVAEFRTAHSGYDHTTSELLSILATYSDVSAKTGVKILTNRMLNDQLRALDPQDDNFKQLIEAEVFQQNAVLLEELEAAKRQKVEVSSTLSRLQAQMEDLNAEKAQVITERDAARAAVSSPTVPVGAPAAADLMPRADVERLQRHRRWLAAALFAIAIALAIGLFPWATDWDWLEHHPRRVALYASSSVAALGTCWAIVDHHRRDKAVWTVLVPLACGVLLSL